MKYYLAYQIIKFFLSLSDAKVFQSLASGVVQLLLAEPPPRNAWKAKATGVACLVKDYTARAFFIRIYHIRVIFNSNDERNAFFYRKFRIFLLIAAHR